MELRERIVVDPDIMVGKPCVRGTRLSVEWIVKVVRWGWTREQILNSYPSLTSEDIEACLEFDARSR